MYSATSNSPPSLCEDRPTRVARDARDRKRRIGGRRSRRLALLLLAALASAPPASAQRGKPKPAPATAPEPDPSSDKKEEAKARFERGMTLFDRKLWDAALAEFLESRAAYPTRANTQNAAIALKNLNRFDEALDMFDALVREFPNLTDKDRQLIEKEMDELRALVGSIEVKTSVDGAQVTIDGRDRGATPLAPIRVAAGSHVVRVYREGFAPFEKRIDVAGRAAAVVEPRLEGLAQSGRLSVTESSGAEADVVVDGIVIGRTPWQGLVAVGDHVVYLRGTGDLGTQPANATVRINQVTPIVLALEKLDSSLRIEPTPSGASVAIDGVGVGSGLWDGRLRRGRHTVEVAQQGFLPRSQTVELSPGKAERLAVLLERDPNSPLWRAERVPRIFAELVPSFPLALLLGGDVADSGSASVPLGVTGRAHLGYQLPTGLAISIDAGYMYIGRMIEDRDTVLRPVGKAESRGLATDRLSLRGLLLGASAQTIKEPLGPKMPVVFRLGVGAFIASARDGRSGTFAAPEGAVNVTPVRTSTDVVYLYVAPEARIGYRLSDHVMVSAGAELLVMVAFKEPQWDTRSGAVLGSQGLASYPAQSFFGSTMLLLQPGISARYDF